MVEVFEVQQQLSNASNSQSRIVEFGSFEEYVEKVYDSLPEGNEIYRQHINHECKRVTIMYEVNRGGQWLEHIHYAEVIG